MGLEAKAPEGWFVRHEVDHEGNMTFTVMKIVHHEYGKPDIFEDQTETAFQDQRHFPWWKRWFVKPFHERVADAMVRSQMRAHALNQQVKLARQLAYDMTKRTQKENPHDD